MALWDPGKRPEYLSWGHEGGQNNCTKSQAAKRLRAVWKGRRPILFHRAYFDLEVAEVHFDLPLPPYDKVRDSMIEAFLYDPNEKELGLKEQAEIQLGIEPDEQLELRDWIYANIPGTKRLKKQWAAHIWRTPGALAGKYAKGDVIRTRKLSDEVYMPWIRENDVMDAYMRELRLLPILIGMAQEGVPIDVDRLSGDIEAWELSFERATKWIQRRLGMPRLNVDSGDQLADAIDRKKLVDKWVETKTGKRSTSKENIQLVLKDRELANVLAYRASMGHALKNMARSWLATAEASNGVIHFDWNQVRSNDAGGGHGARTGRLSSNPNGQNMPKKPQVLCGSIKQAKKVLLEDSEARTLVLPPALLQRVEPLPFMRSYVIAGPGHVVLQRDFSQQEPRILAHFMEGALMEIYLDKPFMDVHTMTTEMINDRTGKDLKRGFVKAILLAVIYARGIPALAASLGIPEEEARWIREQIYKLFPGIKELVADLRRRAALDQPIRTWGGRLYYVEPPGYNARFGKWMSYEYKMINTLIQGSAADHTKQAMINYDDTRKDGRILLQIHDELAAGAPKKAVRSEMKILRESMEGVKFDVPMMSDGSIGETFGDLKDFDDMREAA